MTSRICACVRAEGRTDGRAEATPVRARVLGTWLLALGMLLASITAAAQVSECQFQNPVPFCDIEDLQLTAAPSQLLYAPEYGLLIANVGTGIVTIDLTARTSTTHAPLLTFTDISVSPSGRYVFAGDWGGTNPGPFPATRISRTMCTAWDLATRTWETPETAWEAGRVEAVADDQVIVRSLHQFAYFANERWTGTTAMTALNAPTNAFSGAGWFTSAFGGDFRYDETSGRLLQGDWGLSSQSIEAYRLTGDDFFQQEETGDYGSAQGYGGTVVLATDHGSFYYGALQVDALDVTHRLRVFRRGSTPRPAIWPSLRTTTTTPAQAPWPVPWAPACRCMD